MGGAAVGVRFDSTHLFLDMSDGRAVSFPLDWFPVLQAATAAEREHFAPSRWTVSNCSGRKSMRTSTFPPCFHSGPKVRGASDSSEDTLPVWPPS